MNIEIITEKLKSDASDMQAQLARVKSDMNKMNNAIATLNGMWKGNAREAFNVQYASDYENMTEVCNIVEKIISGMNTAADKYSACDSQVKDIINSIKI